jgi:hypothetical protein
MPENLFYKNVAGVMKSAACPYFNECGIIRPLMKMINSNVWISFLMLELKPQSLPFWTRTGVRCSKSLNDLVEMIFSKVMSYIFLLHKHIMQD